MIHLSVSGKKPAPVSQCLGMQYALVAMHREEICQPGLTRSDGKGLATSVCVMSAGFVVGGCTEWVNVESRKREETPVLVLPSFCPYGSSHAPPRRYHRTICRALVRGKWSPNEGTGAIRRTFFFLWAPWSEEQVCATEEPGDELGLSMCHECFRNKSSPLAIPPYTVAVYTLKLRMPCAGALLLC